MKDMGDPHSQTAEETKAASAEAAPSKVKEVAPADLRPAEGNLLPPVQY